MQAKPVATKASAAVPVPTSANALEILIRKRDPSQLDNPSIEMNKRKISKNYFFQTKLVPPPMANAFSSKLLHKVWHRLALEDSPAWRYLPIFIKLQLCHTTRPHVEKKAIPKSRPGFGTTLSTICSESNCTSTCNGPLGMPRLHSTLSLPNKGNSTLKHPHNLHQSIQATKGQ